MLTIVYVPRIGVFKDKLQIRPTFKEHEGFKFLNRTAKVSLSLVTIIVEFVIDVVEVPESPVQVWGVTDLSTDIA